MSKYLLLTGAVFLLIAHPALAADKKSPMPAPAMNETGKGPATKPVSPEEMINAMFKNMDKDGNGKIDEEEFLAAPKKTFGMRDADHDGFLSKEELMPAPPSKK